jgi:Protein of unknown function (DUF4235)
VVDESTQSNVSKVVGVLVAAGAAWVAQKAVSTAWRATTGHVPPKAEDQGDAGLSEVAVAAAITGAIAALTRVVATRGTARFLS